jgi:hypothetical protein
MKPTYFEQATNFRLWSEYVDPSGHLTESEFNEMTVAEKISIIEGCFGWNEDETSAVV